MHFFRGFCNVIAFIATFGECRLFQTHGERQQRALELRGVSTSFEPSVGSSAFILGQARDDTSDPNNPIDGVKRDAQRTLDKLQSLHDDESYWSKIERDLELLRQKFLPNFKLKPRTLPTACFIFVLGLIWFSVYFRYIYQSDRVEGVRRWQIGSDGVDVSTRDESDDAMADMVFVFHHPELEYDEREQEVTLESLSKVLHAAESRDKQKEFAHLHALKKRARGGAALRTLRSLKSGLDDVVERVSSRVNTWQSTASEQSASGQSTPRAAEEKQAESTPITRADVRVAFLQDFCVALRNWGFSAKVRSSVDYKELFVCVALDDPEAMDLFLKKRQAVLQIQESVTGKLGIEYQERAHVHSPPYIQYDMRTVERLHKAEVLTQSDALEFFKVYHGRVRDGCVLSSHDSIRIIYQEISAHIDLDAAVQNGLLVQWYAVHNSYRVSQLRMCWWNVDYSFVQPIPFVKEYCGSRVAFIFAWNGLQCKALLALVPISLIALLFSYLAEGKGMEEGQILGFSAVLNAWALMVHNQWVREETYFNCLWDDGKDERLVRPQFVGQLLPSLVNANIMEKRYPAEKYAARKLVSSSVTIFFCVMVAFFVHLWMRLFRGKLGIVASLCLTLQIKIFQFIYDQVADFLTDWENHKYQDAHFSSYLFKQFTFQSINNYAAFFYLTIYQAAFHHGCPQGDCLPQLSKQLVLTMIILSVCRVLEVLIQLLCVKFNLWHEDHKRLAAAEHTEALPERQYIEEQAKYSEFRMKDQIQIMMHLMISLGHILVFGSVVPAVVPFCFAVYCVNLGASTWLLAHYAQRPLPRVSEGIGGWKDVAGFLRRIGVGFSAFLLVAHGSLFRDAPFIARLSGFVIYCIAMDIVYALLNTFYSCTDDDTELMTRRRDYVKTAIYKRGMEKKVREHVEKKMRALRDGEEETDENDRRRNRKFSTICRERLSQIGITTSQYTDCVASKDWIDIPCFDGTLKTNCV